MVDKDKIAAIRKIKDDFTGLKVLDIACGPGNNVHLFTGAEYTGIDINEKYITMAIKKYPHCCFIAEDAEKIMWEDFFDVILINSFFHHIDDAKVCRVMEKVAASLKDDGMVILQDALMPGKDEWYHRLLMKLDRGDYFRSLTHWKKLIERAGLVLKRSNFYELRVFGINGYHMILMTLIKASHS